MTLDERAEYRKILQQKEEEIARLRHELGKHKNTITCNFDTLTTNNNDPLALKQEVQDLNIMIDEIEQERDNAQSYAKKLESELAKTKEVLHSNQLNLIEPLQNKIQELEKIVDQKEADIKKRYKWKLRKYKREIEMEKKINQRLKSKISRGNSANRDESTNRGNVNT
jgi:phage host-nuclease inhibitor protein Gam